MALNPRATCQLASGDFVSLCFITLPDSEPLEFRMTFLRYNENAEISVDVNISDNELFAKSIVPTQDGNLLVLANNVLDVDTVIPVVYKLTEFGDLIWMQSYPFHVDFEAVDMVLLDNDEFIVSATNYDDLLFTRNVLFRCSNTGDTIWSEEYIANEDEYARRLRRDEDGNVVVVGEAILDLFIDPFGYIRKVDLDGSTVFRYIVSATDTSIGFFDVDIHNGVYLMAGQIIPPGQSTDGYLHAINQDNDLLWTETYGGEHTDYFRTIARYSNGKVIAAGRTKSFDSPDDYDVFTVQLNSDNSVDFELAYGGDERESSGKVIITQSQQALITSTTRSYNPEAEVESFIFMIDSIGNIVTSVGELASESSNVSIFPNPASLESGFSVSSGSPIDRVEIYSQTGELLLSQLGTMSAGLPSRVTVDFDKELSSGIYFVRIYAVDSTHSIPILLH